ncbi:MAG: hypothetical protein L3J74_06455 [Bacteroidales bacterium]|nr:hypothetical protein [Bacteroidales bacterium]
MKNILLVGIIILSISLSLFTMNCNQNNETIEPEYQFTEIEVPSIYRSELKSTNIDYEIVEDAITFETKSGEKVYGKIRVTFPYNDSNKVIKVELTKNIMEKLNLDTDFFKKYYDTSLKNTSEDNLGDCFVSCEGQERGVFWCKLGCFVVAVIEAASPL